MTLVYSFLWSEHVNTSQGNLTQMCIIANSNCNTEQKCISCSPKPQQKIKCTGSPLTWSKTHKLGPSQQRVIVRPEYPHPSNDARSVFHRDPVKTSTVTLETRRGSVRARYLYISVAKGPFCGEVGFFFWALCLSSRAVLAFHKAPSAKCRSPDRGVCKLYETWRQ